MIKNKSLIKLAISLVLIVSLTAACNNAPQSNSKKKLSGKITILTDQSYEPMLKLAADNFKKENKKVDIDIKVDNNLYNDLELNIKSKDKSIDIAVVEDPYVKYYISKFPGSFLNVTDDVGYYNDKLIKHQVSNLTSKNKVYGFPWSTSPEVIIYRKDIFEKEGISVDDIKTWDDYIEAGQKVTYDTGKKFLTNVESNKSNMYLIMTNQLGTSYFNSDGNLDFNSNKSIKAADMLQKLYSQNILFDLKSRKESISSILNGNSVSMIGDAKYISYLVHNFPSYKDKLEIIKIPAFEPGGNRDVSVGGCNLMINSSSENADAAKEFCKFSMSDDHTIIDSMKNYGYFPVFTPAYNLVEFNKNEGYFNQTVWKTLGSAEKGSMPLNYTKDFLKISEQCKSALDASNLKDKQVNEMLNELQKSLQTDKNIK
ncbi:extracellular solute-binding protein [Clostridium sp. JN-1]|uniref:ABC transporter substrate-binding protein n=1 Tax=Clostridium sp. JN-1 TaxID=2483110 RepID=UPI000F0AFFAD|nr:extracellular solute-binding protein [Clostridium sp. JN-1]